MQVEVGPQAAGGRLNLLDGEASQGLEAERIGSPIRAASPADGRRRVVSG
ncbi:MAG: hypothetical protein WA840_09560 [Caulobacteraceae bacterium]